MTGQARHGRLRRALVAGLVAGIVTFGVVALGVAALIVSVTR